MPESRVVLFESPIITVWHVPSKRLIEHKMHSYTSGPDFRQALTLGGDALEKHKAIKWLSDNRATGALPADDMQWSREQWFPRMVKAGWKYWAIVAPTQVIGQLNMKRIIRAYAEQGITADMFDDIEKARGWLDAFDDA